MLFLGTVLGDLHDIGKNLVAMMIESAGYNIFDLGFDVPAEKFVAAAKENPNVKIVACSALLTSTLPSMKEAVAALKSAGLDGVKVIIGGAQVTQELANEYGADGYAPDAGSAAVKAKELVLLCNIFLPGMNGDEVAMHFRNDDELKDVNLIAVYGYYEPEDKER